MKQLSGLDASFLYMETPSQFGHVSSLSILRAARRPELRAVRGVAGADRAAGSTCSSRCDASCATSRCGSTTRSGSTTTDFDLDFHVRHTAIPPPGTDAQLADLVARIVGRPLDRTRPLWETYVIEGLPDDRFGILTKVHHATVDGASGAELLTLMLDATPEGDELPEAEEWIPERPPTDVEVLARAVANLARKPGRARRAQRPHRPRARPSDAQPGARRGRQPGARRACAARSARAQLRPRTVAGDRRASGRCRRCPRRRRRSTRRSPPHRRFAFRSTSLEAVKGDQERARRDGERRRDGGVRRRPADLARESRRAARRAARRDDPGVDPHRRGDREVDEPGVGHLRRRSRPTSPIR